MLFHSFFRFHCYFLFIHLSVRKGLLFCDICPSTVISLWVSELIEIVTILLRYLMPKSCDSSSTECGFCGITWFVVNSNRDFHHCKYCSPLGFWNCSTSGFVNTGGSWFCKFMGQIRKPHPYLLQYRRCRSGSLSSPAFWLLSGHSNFLRKRNWELPLWMSVRNIASRPKFPTILFISCFSDWCLFSLLPCLLHVWRSFRTSYETS